MQASNKWGDSTVPAQKAVGVTAKYRVSMVSKVIEKEIERGLWLLEHEPLEQLTWLR